MFCKYTDLTILISKNLEFNNVENSTVWHIVC
jgi:hypothetical protein